MSESTKHPAIDAKVAFRPAGFEVHDRVVAEHPAGHVEATAAGVPSRPGAVPPPEPTRPAPRESIAARLRAQIDEG